MEHKRLKVTKKRMKLRRHWKIRNIYFFTESNLNTTKRMQIIKETKTTHTHTHTHTHTKSRQGESYNSSPTPSSYLVTSPSTAVGARAAGVSTGVKTAPETCNSERETSVLTLPIILPLHNVIKKANARDPGRELREGKSSKLSAIDQGR